MPTIAVLGAGPALGLSIARRFGRAGFTVALVSRNKTALDGYVEELAVTNIAATAFPADVTDPDALTGALDAIGARLGAPEVVTYSPATLDHLPVGVLDLDSAELRAIAALNLFTPVDLGHAVLPGMVERGHGSLLFALGSSAQHPTPDMASVATMQSALLTYVRMAAQAAAPHGVHVGAVLIGGLIHRSAAQRKFDGGGFPGFADLDRFDPDDLAERFWRMHTEQKPVADVVGSFGQTSNR
jgi:NAD(P)-dependent dehydrogenase (short-subunit alcohol dehydrogenase family)